MIALAVKNFSEDISEEEAARLANRAKTVIDETVVPAYKTLVQFLGEKHIPVTRESIETVDLPDGEEYYNYLIEYHIILPIAAEEVHQTGMDEVERILGEMSQIIDSVWFDRIFS